MASGQLILVVGLCAGLMASPALAIKVIGDAPGRVAALEVRPESRVVDAPDEADARGLSTMETAVMLLGSLVFSAVLLSRKLD